MCAQANVRTTTFHRLSPTRIILEISSVIKHVSYIFRIQDNQIYFRILATTLRTPCLHVDNSCASSALYAIYYYRSTVAPRGRTSQVTSRAPTKKTLLVFSKRVRVPAFHHRTRVDQGKYLDIVDNRYGQGLETRRRHGRKTRGLALVHTRYESRAIRPLAGISMEVGRDAVPRVTSRT